MKASVSSASASSFLPLDSDSSSQHRLWLDRLMRYAMRIGGISVIAAIALIFFYLLYVVLPLLQPAQITFAQHFAQPAPESGATLILDVEERRQWATRLTDSGQAVFFDMHTGKVQSQQTLPWAAAKVTAYSYLNEKGLAAIGFANGQVLVVQNLYVANYTADAALNTPQLSYPLGKTLLDLGAGQALKGLAIQSNEERTTLAALREDGHLLLRTYNKEVNFLTETVELSVGDSSWTLPPQMQVQHLALDGMQRYLYLADQTGHLLQYAIAEGDAVRLLHTQQLPDNAPVTCLQMLLGGTSVLVGQANGRISQWFPVRDAVDNQQRLQPIREFHAQSAAILAIVPEQRRKGFVASAADGSLGLYHATAHRVLQVASLNAPGSRHLALSPRADNLLQEDAQGALTLWQIDNPHPEISWSSLWRKVWYESHTEPEYLWQSSAASEDAEPKFSLAPLALGTLKASLYALLFAIPLAVLGGIYTAHFMATELRRWVKPGIELMEALPTVILGFIAGLWLAPLLEKHLSGVFALLLIVPLGVVLFAGVWHSLPRRFTLAVSPDGWQAVLLLPVVAGLVWLAFNLSFPIEQVFFAGNMHQWLNSIGITFDQRNAIVVGFAMGFAIIPTIFSMTEEAVAGVPKHLTLGSLALGATPWQTLWRVVLLTASPGIFSAIMIGMGRAVGETMIVLMATGNTPIMDFNIFEGMRTLAANIAIEMPESEYNSSHYRTLFLAAFMLFMFTFLINTITEIVRQRLRKNYSAL